MQKKVFLQRNLGKSRGGAGPYLKYLVIAAACLVLLVVATDYLFRGKSKEVTKRPVPERGAVTKEVPKPAEPPAFEKVPEQAKPPEPAPAPEAVKPPEVQPSPILSEHGPATVQKPSAAEAPPEEKAPPAQSAKPAAPAPKDLFPKKGTPSEAPATAAHNRPAKPEAKTGGPPPAAKPAPSTGTGGYAVQVGAVFKDKSEAEAVRKDLAAKGYSAVIHTVAAGGGGYFVTTGPTPQSKAYTLQEQMKIQGLNNTKVIKVGPTPGPSPKPAPQGHSAPAWMGKQQK